MSDQIFVGKARAPYLLSSYGPGSIVNQGSYAVMPVSSDYWGPLKELSAPLFKRNFNISSLIDLSAMANDEHCVKAILFPDDFYCNSCGLVQTPSMDMIEDIRHLRCVSADCVGELVVSRYVQYCARGHIDRFNYRFFIHGVASQCRLPIRINVHDAAVATTIKCDCGITKSIEFGKGTGSAKCFGRMPWLYKSEQCDEPAHVTMRSSSDIYYSATRSNIALEPEADPEMAKVFEFLAQFDPKFIDGDVLPILSNAIILRGISSEKKQRGLAYMRNLSQTDIVGTAKRIEYDEFQALSTSSGEHGSDLWVEAAAPTKFLRSLGFDGLSAIRKLREVRAIVGFNRGGRAPDPAFDGAAYEEPVPISNRGSALGYENRGEGIFLKFSPERLASWLKRPAVQERSDLFFKAEANWRASAKKPVGDERRMAYILAHTFAHLLIRSISLHCGYSQASLRERVLTSTDINEDLWAGILLYTATSDADGSLGGLVSLALEPERLDEIVGHSLTNTAICSSDPLCALDEPGRYGKLNGAACHACCITPEPCCQRGNRFLDRNLVTPNTLLASTAELCYFHWDD